MYVSISRMYRILAPVDTSEERAKEIARTITAIPVDSSDIEVVILNVFEEFEGVDDGGRVSSESIYDEESFPAAVSTVEAALKEAGIPVEARREHGDPAEMILDVAAEVDADNIVISGRKRSPAGKVLFGSVTQSIILSAECPVTVTTID